MPRAVTSPQIAAFQFLGQILQRRGRERDSADVGGFQNLRPFQRTKGSGHQHDRMFSAEVGSARFGESPMGIRRNDEQNKV